MEEKRGTRETTPPRNNATSASATAWTEKYRPRTLREVVGNPKAVHELRAFADAFEAKKVKAVILYGPPGCGKTSAALALAAEKGWDVVELNASDKRSAEALRRIAGHASESETFTKQRRLIILDEADNIHGSEDRGGAKALYEILKRSEQPIILIANELHKINKRLREQCKIIPFRRLSENAIFNVLRRISAAEHLNIDENTLREIARNAKGDLRSAINDLQATAYSTETALAVATRDTAETIFSVLDKIFRGSDAETAFSSLLNLDMTPEEIERWIYENAHDAFSLKCLCLADIFLRRTQDTGNFRLWKYATSMLACIAQHEKEKRRNFVRGNEYRREFRRYNMPFRSSETSESEAKEIVRKICDVVKVPQRYARELLPLLKIAFCEEKRAAEIACALNLSEAEIAFLLRNSEGSEKELAEKARSILKEAVRMRSVSAWKGETRTQPKEEAEAFMEKTREEQMRVGEEQMREGEVGAGVRAETAEEVGTTEEEKKEEGKTEEKKQKTLSDFF
ncbi:MAG: replication factor C large subunit [Candidatus Methanospirare jalkutatii]|nr:MAG: replication factor C large subunit [Candidatus Methanospirare jalkutatii]